jgi:hypothetical protein
MLKILQDIRDRIHSHLSHWPIIYAFIGGVAVVLFWRGVWHLADSLEIGNGTSILLGILLLLPTGLFVSVFIGDHVIISGLRSEKKMTKETEKEVRREAAILGEAHWETEEILRRLDRIEHQLEKKAERKKAK